MPLQNRVQPTGEIVAHPARGLFMGNRGCLHDDARRLVRERTGQRAWIVCELDFKGRRRVLMAPGRYTELFFLDEAVALAAGHRPCAECRRSAFTAFAEAWGRASGTGTPRAPEMDAVLARSRVDRKGGRITFAAQLENLPDGAFVMGADGPALVHRGRLLPYAPEGYLGAVTPTTSTVTVLTPAPVIDVLRAYRPVLHPSAGPAN